MNLDDVLFVDFPDLDAEEWSDRFPRLAERGLRLAVAAVGWKKWDRRVTHLEALIRKHSSSRKRLLERHWLELNILKSYQHLMLTGRLPLRILDPFNHWVFFACARFALLYDHLQGAARTRLLGAVKSSLDSERGFRPLLWELEIGYVLSSRGFSVGFVDLSGAGRFDYLAKSAGLSFEVECKHIAMSKGIEIDSRAHELLDHAIERVQADIEASGVVWLIEVESGSRLPRNVAGVNRLAENICQAIGGAGSYKVDQAAFTSRPITDWDGTVEHVHRLAPQLADELRSPFVTAFGAPASPFLLVHSVAEEDWRKMKVRWERFLRAACRQFTGDAPAAIFLEFERAARLWGDEAKLGRAIDSRAAAVTLIEDVIDAVGRTRPYLMGVVVMFGGLPFSGGDVIALPNRSAATDASILNQFTQRIAEHELLTEARNRWDQQWLEF